MSATTRSQTLQDYQIRLKGFHLDKELMDHFNTNYLRFDSKDFKDEINQLKQAVFTFSLSALALNDQDVRSLQLKVPRVPVRTICPGTSSSIVQTNSLLFSIPF
ncbi:hypothetical protein AMECASPLE_030436 [Ameca splendens]|uniref:Uncharacterized protein n=1 Tax=Ameca splendens TaxID=208324 RepID=A0ABV0XUX6_9TELE